MPGARFNMSRILCAGRGAGILTGTSMIRCVKDQPLRERASRTVASVPAASDCYMAGVGIGAVSFIHW